MASFCLSSAWQVNKPPDNSADCFSRYNKLCCALRVCLEAPTKVFLVGTDVPGSRVSTHQCSHPVADRHGCYILKGRRLMVAPRYSGTGQLYGGKTVQNSCHNVCHGKYTWKPYIGEIICVYNRPSEVRRATGANELMV